MVGNSARVEGVSVALPQLVTIYGRPVETSILHEPSLQPIHFGSNGPDGNATAVHSEHVLVTSTETLRYWHRRLERTGDVWGSGYWGENLTVSGLPDETELRIGTVLQIGRDAALEIVAPRVPCYKLMWRIGMPDGFVRQMMRDGRVGYYARVLKHGWVGQGDAISVSHCPEHDMTIARLAYELAADVEGDLGALEFALGLPAIGKQAAGGIRRKISRIVDGNRCAPHRWAGWREFRVADKREASPGVTMVLLEADDGKPIAAFRGGQHVAVKLPSGLVRNWTLSDFADTPHAYRISVKRVAGGRGSSEVARLEIGAKVSLRAPSGNFYIDPAGLDRNVLISAGIGLTPMLAMVKARLSRSAGPPIVWIHATQSGESHTHRDEIDQLLADAPAITRFTAYSRPAAADRRDVDFHHLGRLTAADIRKWTEPYPLYFAGRTAFAPGTESQFYLCGPPEFEAMARATLLEAGVPAEQIHREQFGPHDAHDGSTGPGAAVVRFEASAVTAAWSADDPVSLLDLAESSGLTPDFDCRSGECHRCATRLLKGAVTYPVRPIVPPKQDTEVLICCARPASEDLSLAL